MGDMGRRIRACGNEQMPKSLEKLLTVDKSGGAPPPTSTVPKSEFLAKLDAFLPQLKAANNALLTEDSDKLNSIPAPTIVEPTMESGLCEDGNRENQRDEWSTRRSSTNDDEPVVHMDVYINDELGELVANPDSVRKEEEEKENPLIEVVEDKNEGENDA